MENFGEVRTLLHCLGYPNLYIQVLPSLLWICAEGGAQRGKALMVYMVQLFTNPGDVLVDFTAGTGVLLDAASSLGRHAVGLEAETNLCNTVLIPKFKKS